MRAPTGRLLRLWLPMFGLVCVLMVSGCTDPDQPATLPDDTPTATSTSASPTPSTPEEEVEAAVRAYYAELTRAAQTQDTARLKSLMTRGCPCYGYARSIDRTRKKGQTAPGAAWTLETVRVHGIGSGTASAEVTYVVEPYEVLNAQGEVVNRFPRRGGHVDLSLVDGQRGWIIGNVFNLEA